MSASAGSTPGDSNANAQPSEAAGAVKYEPSAFERAMQAVGPDKPAPLDSPLSFTYTRRSYGGARSVYKPKHLQGVVHCPNWGPRRYGIPRWGGHLTAAEVGAYRVDEAFGFGRVPPTAMADGPYGPGFNQFWVHSAPSYPLAAWSRMKRNTPWAAGGTKLWPKARDTLWRLNAHCPKPQREQMAVLDYVIGNTDRHWGNYRTGRKGEIVAIDNALSFPEFADSRTGIRSDFVTEFCNVELSDDVMRQVRAVDTDQLRAALLDAGLSEKSVNGALDRLNEIRTHGKIALSSRFSRRPAGIGALLAAIRAVAGERLEDRVVYLRQSVSGTRG